MSEAECDMKEEGQKGRGFLNDIFSHKCSDNITLRFSEILALASSCRSPITQSGGKFKGFVIIRWLII